MIPKLKKKGSLAFQLIFLGNIPIKRGKGVKGKVTPKGKVAPFKYILSATQNKWLYLLEVMP